MVTGPNAQSGRTNQLLLKAGDVLLVENFFVVRHSLPCHQRPWLLWQQHLCRLQLEKLDYRWVTFFTLPTIQAILAQMRRGACYFTS